MATAATLACSPAAACPRTQDAGAEAAPREPAPPPADRKFGWPARGRIFYGCGIKGRETITIAARNGAEVGAAQSGVVAFAGELKRYGDVILIKHDGGFISAYHGDIGDLRVKRNDFVAGGQAIAAMRAPEGETAELSFELRRGVEWIDPRPLMRTDEPPSENGVESLSAK